MRETLGGQAGHGGGADVVDPGSHRAQPVLDAAAVFLEGGRPGRTVRLDDEQGAFAITVAVLEELGLRAEIG